MKNRKVLRVSFHIAPTINHNVKSSLDAKINEVDMTLTQIGVLIVSKDGSECLVPFGNVHWLYLEPEAAPEK